MTQDIYYQKYLKYKQKYLELKSQIGGNNNHYYLFFHIESMVDFEGRNNFRELQLGNYKFSYLAEVLNYCMSKSNVEGIVLLCDNEHITLTYEIMQFFNLTKIKTKINDVYKYSPLKDLYSVKINNSDNINDIIKKFQTTKSNIKPVFFGYDYEINQSSEIGKIQTPQSKVSATPDEQTKFNENNKNLVKIVINSPTLSIHTDIRLFEILKSLF